MPATEMSNDNNSYARRRFDEAVFLIAVGLIEKDELYERSPHSYPYSSSFRHGLNVFAALCAQYAAGNAACMLDGLSESRFIRDYCTRDVDDWVEEWTEEVQAAVREGDTHFFGALAYVNDGLFVPTDECFELALCAENDVVGAYQERKVYEFLRAGTQEQYVLGRKFLIEHPILSWDAFIAARTGRYDFGQGSLSNSDLDWIAELLEMAYEEAPCETRVCPTCGWTMARRDMQVRCSSLACCDPVPDYEGLEKVPHGSCRLLRGVMHYIASPGKVEMLVAKKADELGLPFELWPRKDACDVLIALPDGTRLAIDAKAYGSPLRLAEKIKNDRTADVVGANEVIYVVPDDAEAKHPRYCAICNRVLPRDRGYSCCVFKDLSKRLANSCGKER